MAEIYHIFSESKPSGRDVDYSCLLSSANATATANIPPYSEITNATLLCYYQLDSGLGNGDLAIFFANSSGGSVLSLMNKTSDAVIKSEKRSKTFDITAYAQSKAKNAGNISCNSATQIIMNGTASLSKTWIFSAQIGWKYNPPTFVISLTAGTGGTVSGAGTYEVGSSATIKATPNSGYRFVKWSDGNTSATRTITKTTSDISANVTNLSYSATFEKINTTCTVNFKNADGSVVSSKTLNSGSTLGTLPTVSRSGYTFVGWIPCAPARKTDDTVLDSCRYTGDSGSFYALHQRYKYTDNLSVHIEAYMSSWEDIETLKAQIISCTESGGWGLGYQANTTGHGCELYAGGYKGINLGFGTDGVFSDKTWYSFDIVFSGGTFEVYVNGTKKGTQTTSSTTISYNADNTIFVGAEAAKSTTTPGGNYFKGYISNVFIANKGTRLAIATTSTVVEGNVDYYPVWRLNPTYTITASAENGSVLGGGTYEEGKTVTLTAIPNDGYVFKQWSDGNTDNPRTVTVTGDVTYTAEFESAMPEFTLVQMLYNNKQISKDNKVPAGQSFRLIAGVK